MILASGGRQSPDSFSNSIRAATMRERSAKTLTNVRSSDLIQSRDREGAFSENSY